MISQDELSRIYPSAQSAQGPNLARRWQPELELHPDDSKDEWENRSRVQAERRQEQAERHVEGGA